MLFSLNFRKCKFSKIWLKDGTFNSQVHLLRNISWTQFFLHILCTALCQFGSEIGVNLQSYLLNWNSTGRKSQKQTKKKASCLVLVKLDKYTFMSQRKKRG